LLIVAPRLIIKKCSQSISRILYLQKQVSVIYLDLMLPLNSSGLPLGIERAILHAPIYLTLQPLSSTDSYISIRPGKFLPYLLTLTSLV